MTHDAHEALKVAIGHIEHMAAWITATKINTYSFESLGEDMPWLREALTTSAPKGKPGYAAGFEACRKAAKDIANYHAVGNGDQYDDADIGGCTTATAIHDAIAALPQPITPKRHSIEFDGFTGTVIGYYTTLEGKEGVVLQQDGTRVVHVYGRKHLKPAVAEDGYYAIQSALSPHIASSTELMAAMSSIWPLIKPHSNESAEARLREALKPFAEQADTHGDQIPDSMFIDDYERDPNKPWYSFARLTVGDLRRAKRAYNALFPPSGGDEAKKSEGGTFTNCASCDMPRTCLDHGRCFGPSDPADRREIVARRGIYVASKTKHAERWKSLRASGLPIISTWIDEAGEGETSDFHDLWHRCLTEAAGCQVLIAYREGDEVLKGGWVEIGAALSAGVPVYAVGLDEFTIAKYRGITHFPDMKSALAALDGGASE